MSRYPLVFRNQVTAGAGSQRPWACSGEGFPQEITMAIPPSFNGPGGAPSPEDLYALALANCFVATFKVYAEKARLEYTDLTVVSELAVDRGEGGFPWMARLHLQVKISGVNDRELAEKWLRTTSTQCMVIRSTKTEVTFDFQVVA